MQRLIYISILVFVTTTFPDDVEGSSIQAEDLLKPTQAVKEPPKVFDKVSDASRQVTSVAGY